MKILSPAGNMESLKMAVINGADEVYLGINSFNARNNIDGFSIESLKNTVDYAHIFNVKVLLAINILFSDAELQSAVDTVIDAYNLGVDAFIIQDLGLADVLCKNYPNIELHASTQMGLHNLEGVKAIQKFGFKRVVLARETPLAEIKRIKQNTGLEIEYFAQGALCVSFSGNCYISSYLNNASGNRGKCKQLCRLPYTLLKDGKPIKKGYLLSAKDFNMTSKLKDLESAGVDVLKIEGRARRPYYVATATREYYKALHGEKVNQENLKLGFNREYTAGYFDGNGTIISAFNNHIGVFIGKVEKVIKGKNFDEVYFTSKKELAPKSTFKFYDGNQERTTLSAYDLKQISNGKYKLTTTQNVNTYDNVHLIIDALHEYKMLNQTIKRDVDINIHAKPNSPITAEININNKNIKVEGNICQLASNQPITEQDLINNFAKSDIFNAKLNIKELGNVFMQKKQLNNFRREVFDRIYNTLTLSYRHKENKIKISNNYKVKKFLDFEFIENLDNNFNATNIIYSPCEYSLTDVQNFISLCQKLGKNAFLDTPNFALEEDIKLLENIIKQTNINIVANNYYALTFDTNIIVGAGLNVYNTYTAKVYDLPIITAESDISTKINYPYMTLRHCPLKSHLGANCKNCPYKEGYTYKMDSGKIMKLKRKKISSCTFYLSD